MYKEMQDILNKQNNTTLTENGDTAFRTTNNAVLDLFGLMGGMRYNTDDFKLLFDKAYRDNKVLAIAALLNLRDIRGGMGERNLFRLGLEYIANNETDEEIVCQVIQLTPELGRWDDLMVFLDTPYETHMSATIARRLANDLTSDNPSLCAKWLPSENATNKKTVENARKLIKLLGISPKKYRKILSELRKKINIVETNLVKKEYNNIDYNKVPGHAMKKYYNAFGRNDEYRFTAYLEGLIDGKSKVNTSALYPYDIIDMANELLFGCEDISEQLIQSQWDNLERVSSGKTIVVRDGSGSMIGKPLNIATSLAILISEQLDGAFKDSFITFSANPEIVTFNSDMSLIDKLKVTYNYDDMMNTNIEKVYDLIFETMKVNPESELDNIIIISDMEFDRGVDNVPTYKSLKNKFDSIGKKIPTIVFWNVDARDVHFPTTDLEYVQLVSGASHHIMKSIFDGNYNLDAYSFMMEVLKPYVDMLGYSLDNL